MKVVDFPDKTNEEKAEIQGFLDEVKSNAEENNITQAVVVMMDEDGSVGVSASGSYINIMAMMAIAMKEI